MVDIALLFGKFVFLALVYLFLFAAIRVGVGLVAQSSPKRPGTLVLKVIEGPEGLLGTVLPIRGPLTIGRAAESDIVIGDDFISSRHARVSAIRGGAVLEDLGSTNGTVLNGRRIEAPSPLSAGDIIELGTVRLKVEGS